MADRDAKVRLNLAANGFLTQLQQLQAAAKDFEKAVEGVGDGGEKASKKLGAFGTAAKAGLGAAKTSLSELGSSLKSTLTMIGTFGGALSVAGAARGALELKQSYKDIAFGLQAGTEKAVTWQSVQTQIEGTAGRWKQSNKDVAATYGELATRMNDAKKASAATESIAKFALAGVAPMQTLTRIAASLTEQFKIKPEGLDDGLAQVVALARKAKMPIDELEPKMQQLGATAKTMGMEGAAGLQKMMGMLVLAAGTGKNTRQTFTEITDLFAKLSDPSFLKDIGQKMHLKLDNHGTPKDHVMEMIVAHSGGKHEELAKFFSGADLALVTAFGAVYKKAADGTKGDLQAKTHAGLAALDEAMKQAGKSEFNAAEVDRQAADNAQDAHAKIQDALNRLETAFTKPKMIDALEKLADIAPKVVDALAKLLGFAVDHPKTAVAAVVGAKVGSAVVPAVTGSLLSAGGKGLWKMAAKLFGRSAATAAAGAEGAAAAEGTAAAGGAAAAAGGVTAAAAALAAAPVVITAGAALYTGHKINQRMGTKGQDLLELSQATEGARLAMGGSDNQKRSAASELRARLAASRATGHSALDDIFGGVARTITGSADPNKQARGKAETQLHALERSLNKGSVSGDRVAAVMNRVADSAERMNAVFAKFGGPDGSNGLPGAPGNESGSTPR